MPNRYETIQLLTLRSGTDKYGQWKTAPASTKQLGAEVLDTVSNFVVDKEAGTRVYQDMTNFRIRNSSLLRQVSINNGDYAIRWRNTNYKINDVKESNDRHWATLYCETQLPTESL